MICHSELILGSWWEAAGWRGLLSTHLSRQVLGLTPLDKRVMSFRLCLKDKCQTMVSVESKWTMFSTTIVSAAIWSFGHKWTLEVRDAVKLKKESYQARLACGLTG